MSSTASPRPVPALDLKAQYRTIQPEIDEAIRRVVDSQHFCLGPEVTALEAELAAYCGVAHGVGCSSGSDALLLALMAWDVGPGDEVITTPYTFFATAGAVWRLGARPVFVDIEPDTYNIAPALVERAVTPRTRVIIPVHLYGQSADMDAINAIARRHGLKVLEDAAQAIGARYQGRPIGSIGDAAAFSFYPSKNLGGYGDGGLVTTPDDACARRLARLRVHGMEPRYHHHEVGYNARLDAIQAAVLRVKLRHLPAWTEARRQVAARYRTLFRDHGLTDRVGLPVERPGLHHAYNQFVIRVPEEVRDPLRARLTERQIGNDVYYPIPLHLQLCFQALGHRPGDFPVSEQAARQTIALPIYPELTEDAQAYVVATIAELLDELSPAAPSRGIPRPHVLGEVPSRAASNGR